MMSQPKDFTTLQLSPLLLEVVAELGYTRPTPIQAQAIPLMLEGRDIIGQSKTGSGKTAAFTLPILEQINLNDRSPQAIILCPTRELCVQVAREVRRLGCRHPGLQVVAVAGGMPSRDQKLALQNGAQIVVGTPGRTLDHLTRGSLDLSNATTVVLDEADRMLEMGFEDQMRAILKKFPKKRQTVLFSATFPDTIETLSRDYQTNPISVTVETGSQSGAAIEQQVYEVAIDDKVGVLLRILRSNQPDSAIIFCNRRVSIIELSKSLEAAEVPSVALHGELEQRDRDRAMARFRNKSCRILIATDVAARGLDIENLDMVINFDMPLSPDIYVHRIGRTGRAGKRGLAVTLATDRDERRLSDIEEFTGKKLVKKALAALKQRELRGNVLNKAPDMETLYISGGRKDKMRPGDILGALTGDAGRMNSSDIGKIEIHDHFSYVAVSKRVAQNALEKLRDGRIKGHKFQIKMVR